MTKTATKKKTKKAVPRKAVKRIAAPVEIPETLTITKEVAALSPMDPQALLDKAIEKGLPLESLQKLLDMRRELKAEWAKERFFEDLPRFQSACPIIGKSKTAKGKNFSYKYAPLEEIVSQIKKPLEQFGFSYTIVTKQTDHAVTAICNAHHIDGHTESSEFTIPIDPEAFMNDSQKIASAMTYATRYALRNAFGIVTGDTDDDGESTGERGRAEQEPELRPPQARKMTSSGGETRAASAPTGPYAQIMITLNEQVKSKEGPMVALFGGGEKLEWKHKADGDRNNPEDLRAVLEELEGVAKTRRERIQGGI